MRSILLCLLAFGLSGCRLVESDRPLFGEVQVANAPQLKPGLWAIIEPGCRFNTHTAPAKWPDCATAYMVDNGAVVDARVARSQPASIQVIDGDPAILQGRSQDPGLGGGRFVYAGLRPLAVDAGGYVSRARVWPAVYSDPRAPPPPPTRRGKRSRGTGLDAGLTPLPDGDCLARAGSTVRRAVAASEAWAFVGDEDDAGRYAYWLRPR